MHVLRIAIPALLLLTCTAGESAPQTDAPKQVQRTTDVEFNDGSRIEAGTLSSTQVANLATLCKVWGFVKYRHPKVAAGEVQWDFELFRVLPRVLSAKDRAGANAAIEAWLAKLGDPVPCSSCAHEPKDVQSPSRLAWISDRTLLGDSLVRRLAMIQERRIADGNQYYVGHQPNSSGALNFKNELPYPKPADPGYRLLGLFRFWNIIESWYPYREVMNEDWDKVLATFIPRIFSAATADAYALEMMQVVARVHDSHVNLWSSNALRPPVGECLLSTPLRFLDGQFVVDQLPDTTAHVPDGLLPGDAILAIDGALIEGQPSAWFPYYGASNEAASGRDMARALTRGHCGNVRVKIDRGGKTRELTLQRTPGPFPQPAWTHDRPCQTFVRLSDDLAYLKLSSVRVDDAADYVRRAQGARVLLIDARNYPSQFVVFALGQHLVSKKTEFATFTSGDFTNPGAFVWKPGDPLEPKEPRFHGKVVVLVDETTQSQGEYTALALRSAPEAIVVGSTTAGADGDVAAIWLPGGLWTMISSLGIFTANRKPTQRIGIIPDFIGKPTREGIAAGRDEVLEAAVRRGLGRALTSEELSGLKLPAAGAGAKH